MDNFREWLSDNLRYILLGLGILFALVILFFGVRLLSSVLGESDPVEVIEKQEETKEDAQKDDKQEEREDGQQQAEPEVTVTPEATPEPDENALKKAEYPQVNTLMESYYTALGKKDVATLKTLVDQLDPTEEAAIVNSRYIEGYSNVETYTKKGLTETSYVVFVTYGHKYVDHETVLPGMSCLYVDTKADGTLYVVAQPTKEQTDRMTEATAEADVQELLHKTQAAYDQAVAQDKELKTFLENLGIEGSAAMSAENGTVIIAEDNCNVREQANAESAKVAELISGQEVKKIGQEGDWIQIEVNGVQGFVRGDLFQ